MPERLDNLQLSFPTWSVSLQQNEFQGSQPPLPPMPILGGAQASLLQVGQSFFSIPASVYDMVAWRFVGTHPTREGHRDALGEGRAWGLIQLVGQLETPQLEAEHVYQDEALTLCHLPTSQIPRAASEIAQSGGCPLAWVFASRLRVFLAPPPPPALDDRGCLGCLYLYEDMLNRQAAVEVLWWARIGQPQENSIEAPNNREFPLYEYHLDVCTFGHFPLIRRAFFF